MLDFIAAHPLVSYLLVAGTALIGFMLTDGGLNQ